MYKPIISTAALLLSLRAVQAIPDPIICEDTLDGSPPFDSRDVPCILGCGVPVAIATGSLLPGSVNETDIPYCQLNCVHDDATPAQSAAAPDCRRSCQVMNQATPENIGVCEIESFFPFNLFREDLEVEVVTSGIILKLGV